MGADQIGHKVLFPQFHAHAIDALPVQHGGFQISDVVVGFRLYLARGLVIGLCHARNDTVLRLGAENKLMSAFLGQPGRDMAILGREVVVQKQDAHFRTPCVTGGFRDKAIIRNVNPRVCDVNQKSSGSMPECTLKGELSPKSCNPEPWRMQPRVNQEHKLLDYVERLAKHAEDRSALHMHYSRLKPHNRQERHMRMVGTAFSKFLKRQDSFLFRLSNEDQILIIRNADFAELEPQINAMRTLFSNDPAAQGSDLFTWYDLSVDYYGLLETATRLKSAADLAHKNETGAAKPGGAAVRQMPQSPINPSHLGRLVDQLSSMDISSLLRRQPVCALTDQGDARPVFNELFVSIADLRRTVIPDVDLLASRPLFSYLTQYLDRRILRAMPDIEASVPLSTSININVETVMSPLFLEFDQKLRNVTRKTIVLEFQAADIFSDIRGFAFARDFVRQRGYRVCLDGVNDQTLQLIEKKMLRLDLQKLTWGAGTWDESPDGITRMAETVRRVGATRIVLCRCDDQKAVDFGRALGINLFQGHHLDQLLARRAERAVA